MPFVLFYCRKCAVWWATGVHSCLAACQLASRNSVSDQRWHPRGVRSREGGWTCDERWLPLGVWTCDQCVCLLHAPLQLWPALLQYYRPWKGLHVVWPACMQCCRLFEYVYQRALAYAMLEPFWTCVSTSTGVYKSTTNVLKIIFALRYFCISYLLPYNVLTPLRRRA